MCSLQSPHLHATSLSPTAASEASILLSRKSDGESRSLAQFGLDINAAVMALHDAAADGQAQPDSAPTFFRGQKGSKMCGRMSGAMPAPSSRTWISISVSSGLSRPSIQRLPPLGHGIDSIHDQGQQDLFDLLRIARNTRQILCAFTCS